MFWVAQMVSLAGTWMQSTGQQWLVLTLTNSPLKLGLVASAQWTPVLFLALFAGVVADRLPKRKILIVTQSLLAVLALALGALTVTGRVQYWHVLVAATLTGCVQAFDMPTRQAFVVEMTSRDDLLNAIALNSTIFNLARIVGPSLAGLVIEATGTGWAFILNGLSFLPVVLAFAAMKVPDRVRPHSRSALDEIRTGLDYVRRTPTIMGILTLLGIISIFALNFNVLVPTLVRITLGGGASQYGFLLSVMGTGALLGSIVLATMGGSGPRMQAVVGGAMLLGAGELALFATSGWAASAAALFVCGAAMVTFSASANTTIQVTAPDELRGRVMSVHSLVFTGVTPVGAFIAGTLAQYLGARATFGIVGGIALVTTVTMRLAKLLPAPPGTETAPEKEGLSTTRRESAKDSAPVEDVSHGRQS